MASVTLSSNIKAFQNYPAVARKRMLKRPLESIITVFPSGHGWTKQSAAGTQADDTTSGNYVTGDRSLKLTTDGAASAVFTRKLSLTALNCTTRNLKIRFKIDNTSDNLTELSVYATSDSMSNYSYWTLPTDLVRVANEWYEFVLDWSKVSGSTGSLNRAAITGYQIRIKDKNGVVVNMWVDALGSVPITASTGVVSVVFDDSWESQITEGLRIMSPYGQCGAIYAIPDNIATSGYATIAQLKQAQQAGWDICWHHQTALNTFTQQELVDIVESQKRWHQDNGFMDGMDDIAYPNGVYSQTILDLCKTYFRSGRTTVSGVEHLPPADPYKLKTFLVVNTTTPAAISTAIADALTNKHWLILTYHKLVTTPTVSTEHAIADFATEMADAATQGAVIVPPSRVLADYLM